MLRSRRVAANPAESLDDVAGLIDATGRVLGLMPHPERNVSPWHRPGTAPEVATVKCAGGSREAERQGLGAGRG